MKRWFTGMSLLIATGGVTACPLCGDWQDYGGAREPAYRQRTAQASAVESGVRIEVIDATKGENRAAGTERAVWYRLDRDTAANAVLALPDERGGRLKVVEVIRGDFPLGGTIEPRWIDRIEAGTGPSTQPLLLIRARNWQSWANLGPVSREHAGWLRNVAASKPAADMTEADWQANAAFMLPYLESPEPMVAEIAYGELARAPYSALRWLKGHFDVAMLRQWAADPNLAKRQSLYTLLVGVGGDTTDATGIEQQLDAAWKAKDAANLGPMLAADLELRGPSRMGWIDAKYMRDRDRTTKELQAVLLALSVQGAANATIPRERVIESYRIFIEVQKPLAGFVAQDLATWNYWEAAPEYVALLRSDLAQHPASRYAMQSYLRQSPRADATAAITTPAIPAR